jgi:hypothetical protein
MDVYRIDDDGEDGGGTPGEAETEPERAETSGLGAFVSEHPLATLGGALAFGYVLGGGLGSPLARRVLRAGVRFGFQLAVLPELEDDIAGLASRVGQAVRKVADATERPPRPANGTAEDVPSTP